jgi:hypothetical protein
LKEATVGMVLAQPVTNEKGLTLAAPGTEITDRLLIRFENMNVEAIFVATDDKVDSGKAEAMKKDIEARFSEAGDSDVWKDLKEILLMRVTQRVK